MRVTKFDIECADRLREARDRIPCSADVPVYDDSGNVVDWVTGPECMAKVDITRLTVAKTLARDAERLARDRRAGDKLTAAEAEAEGNLKAEAAMHRATVRSFDKDREDIVLRRGRNKPTAVHGPARPFASSTQLQPTDRWICPECGRTVRVDNCELLTPEMARRLRCTASRCSGRLQRLWVRPALAERWALVQARAEAKDGVQYRRLTDAAGVWLGTVAVTHRGDGDDPAAVGFGALLEIAACAPTGPRDSYRIAESRDAARQARSKAEAELRAAVDAAVARADTVRRVEAEVEAHSRRHQARADLVVVEARYGGCAEPALLESTPRTKRTRRGRKGKGKGDRSTQRKRREGRAAGGPQNSNRASRKVLATAAARKREGRYYQGKALGSKRSV